MRAAQKPQQLNVLLPLAAGRVGRSAGGTPTPGYARSPVPLQSGTDDGDDVGDGLVLCDSDAVALPDGEFDGESGGGAVATRVELALGARPSNDVALGQTVAFRA